MDVCENLILLKILRLLYTGIKVIRIVVPIALMIKLMIDVYHHILNPDSKQIKELSIKRIIAAIVVFLSPIFVNLVLKLVEVGGGNRPDYPYCLTTLDNIGYFERLAEAKRELKNENKKVQDNAAIQKAQWDQAQKLLEEAKKSIIDDSSALYLGQRYQLSDRELRGLCGVAKAEQGTITGAQAEASLMANLYELLSSKSKFYQNGLYNYVRNGGWFAHAADHMDNNNCSPEYLNAVRDVLVNGNRTLPLYVNEHDCMNCSTAHACGAVSKGDICKINTNGIDYTTMDQIKNKANYVRDNTKVYTYYMRNDQTNYWIFHSFPGRKKDPDNPQKYIVVGDPFGYTLAARQRVERMGR